MALLASKACTDSGAARDERAPAKPIALMVTGTADARPAAMHLALRRGAMTLLQHAHIGAHVGKSGWRRKRLMVLCYHGVSRWDEHEWNPTLYISQVRFARRMEVLRRLRCNVLPLGEAIERLARDDLPERATVLTFDDGYFDFLTTAFPILKSYRYPSTVYLPTLRCEHNLPIASLLISYMLWHRRDAALDGADLPGLSDRSYPLASAQQRESLVRRLLVPRGAGHDSKTNDNVARLVAERLRIPYEHFVAARLMTLLRPAEVSSLSSEGIDFELHTHRHESPAEPELFIRQIRINRERIAAMTGRRAEHFCWPSGLYRREHLPLLKAEGVLSATTCDRGLASRRDDPLLLPRFVDTSVVSEAEFVGWVEGVGAWMPHRRAASAAAEPEPRAPAFANS
jgi:peptidoglycan/xylan/chitin deacetylase (PgdA/CDA1 family)